jgi:hypothetical protein
VRVCRHFPATRRAGFEGGQVHRPRAFHTRPGMATRRL